MLTKEQYLTNLKRAKAAFEKAGMDTSYTLSQAVEYFLKKTGFENSPGRKFFHEAMHVAANALSGNGTAEARALNFEQVFCRGKYLSHNSGDNEQFGMPEPVPSNDDASISTRFFSHFANAAYPAKKDISSSTVDQASYSAYNQAIRQDTFFTTMTGGRALYQLSTSEARELPVVFLGIVPNGDTLRMSFPAMNVQTQSYIVGMLDPDTYHNSAPPLQNPATPPKNRQYNFEKIQLI